MMKPLFPLLACLLYLTAPAQTAPVLAAAGGLQKPFIRLSGRVTDSLTGQPLPGASVYFTEARIGAIANAAGRYLLNNVPKGHHLVEISHTGYNPIVEHIDIEGETEMNFVLTPTVVESQGVTVTGVTSATNIRNTPIPVTLVRRAHLLQAPSTQIMDILSRQPGVAQVNTGPAIAKPVIRGLGYNRVVVVNDGVRQEGQQWGDEHGIEIDELSVQRAEILKGPASITYGSDALAGVIHFITNVPVAEGEVKGNVYTSYQTNNGQYGLNGSLAGNRNGFNWNAYGSGKWAKDYRNRWDGRVLNSRFNERNFGGYAGLNKSWGFTHLIFSAYNQHVGLTEGDRDSATGRFLLFAESPLERVATAEDLNGRSLLVPFQQVQHYKLVSDNSFVVGTGRLKVNVGFQNNLRREFGDPENTRAADLFFDLKTLSYQAHWVLAERGGWQTSLGAGGLYQTNHNRGAEVIIPEYRLRDLGGFAFTQKYVGRLTLSGGLRYDHRALQSQELMEGADLKFPSFRRTFSNFSGSAGLSYRPTQIITLKANLARGFRAPTLSELASNGAHEGTNRYEYGQQDLSSEKSLQADAGFQADYEHISLSVSGFYNRLQDFIFYRRLQGVAGGDSVLEEGGELLEAFRYSQHNAALRGLEAVIDLHPHPLDWLHFENTFSFVRGSFAEAVEGSRNLPLVPAPRWLSELRVNLAKAGKAFRNLYLRAEMDRTFQQRHPFTGYGTETATGGYTLFNAGIGSDIGRNGKTLFSLHLAGSNLTDVAYQQHLSRLKYRAVNAVTGRQGIFNMGRNFSVKLNIPISFAAHH